MKTLELSILDRVKIPMLLPGQGGLITMRLAQDLRKKTEFSIDEITKCKLTDLGNGQISWDGKVSILIDIDVSPEQVDMLKKGLELADQQQAITFDMLGLIEKIEAI